MAEFRPYGLFYDVLSGEFTPPSDPEHSQHTLARLAVATSEKGRGPDDCRDYVPSWAQDTYTLLETDIIGDHVLSIGSSALDKSNFHQFADFTSDPARGPRDRHELVITDNTGLEVVHPLELGPRLNELRAEIAKIAQKFYDQHPRN